jgi:hypothetical protein
MRQIARALVSPLLGAESFTSEFLEVLADFDDEARIDRSLEPEWLVAETLMALCHEGNNGEGFESSIRVGDIDNEINKKLRDRHEGLQLSAKKVGMVLRSLGLPARRRDRSGCGFMFTSGLKRKIREIAAQLGIDRRALATTMWLRINYGGVRCALCQELGVTGGLPFTATKGILRHP